MRKYNIEVSKDEYDDCASELRKNDTTEDIRNEYYFHCDDACYWAKRIAGKLYRSNDDVFNTQKLDATHIIVFIK